MTKVDNEVAAAIEGAERREARPEDKGKGKGRGGGGGAIHPNSLPKDAPIRALGKDRLICHYINGNGQYVSMEQRAHNRLNIAGLFAPQLQYVADTWPTYNKEGEPTGKGDFTRAAELCINQCAIEGIWNPTDRLRGRGAWRGVKGELIFHCGDQLVVTAPPPADPHFQAPSRKMRRAKPGVIGEYVYPAARPLPPPYDGQVRRPQDIGEWLLRTLETWQWKRGRMDALLMAGWIAASLLGGALEWRPVVWVTGRKGTGKSTLLERLIGGLLGDWMIYSSDSTAAGIWQKIEWDTRAIGLDEIEPDESNSQKAQNIIHLARQASSGGVVLRGGAMHEGVTFTARSCFMFTSILIPSLLAQDKSRMAILELNPLDAKRVPPPMDATILTRKGSEIMRQLADEWWRFEETLKMFRLALQDQGHDARGADQFGTLLACASLLTGRGLQGLEHEVQDLAAQMRAEDLAELDGTGGDEIQCIQHLLTYRIEIGKTHQPLGWYLQKAVRRKWAGHHKEWKELNMALAGYGVRIHEGNGKSGQEGATYVAVATGHNQLSTIFSGTMWSGRSGAQGVWVQSLERLDCPGGAKRTRDGLWFAGMTARAVLIPVEFFGFVNNTKEADEVDPVGLQGSVDL